MNKTFFLALLPAVVLSQVVELPPTFTWMDMYPGGAEQSPFLESKMNLVKRGFLPSHRQSALHEKYMDILNGHEPPRGQW